MSFFCSCLASGSGVCDNLESGDIGAVDVVVVVIVVVVDVANTGRLCGSIILAESFLNNSGPTFAGGSKLKSGKLTNAGLLSIGDGACVGNVGERGGVDKGDVRLGGVIGNGERVYAHS